MRQVEIRELAQDADAVLAAVARSEVVLVTDHGAPVAHLTAVPPSRLQTLVVTGRARPVRRGITDLPEPAASGSVPLSAHLADDRESR